MRGLYKDKYGDTMFEGTVDELPQGHVWVPLNPDDFTSTKWYSDRRCNMGWRNPVDTRNEASRVASLLGIQNRE